MYDWIKALHVIAVISWMAGMLYLPRLFVYHASAAVGSELSATLKIMESRLLRFIMNPAMIVAWCAGLYLAWAGNWHAAHWFQAKFLAVIAMSGVHGYLVGRLRDFDQDRNTKTPRFYRLINEVPTVLLIIIVILVIVKPF